MAVAGLAGDFAGDRLADLRGRVELLVGQSVEDVPERFGLVRQVDRLGRVLLGEFLAVSTVGNAIYVAALVVVSLGVVELTAGFR